MFTEQFYDTNNSTGHVEKLKGEEKKPAHNVYFLLVHMSIAPNKGD